MSEWKEYTLGEILVNHDKKRKPLSARQRENFRGEYRYFGAQGVIDHVADFIFDGEYLLIAEDGENLQSRNQPIAQIVKGRFWVNNHAHIVTTNEKADMYLVMMILNHINISAYVTGAAQPKLNQENLNKITIKLPEIDEQIRISSILSSLDSKIECNNKICKNLEEEAQALFKHWFVDFAPFKEEKFIDSELGLIPEGWREGNFGEIVTQIKEKVGDRQETKVLSPINTGKLVLSDEFFTKQVYSKSISKYIMVKPNNFAYNPARVNIGSIGRNEFDFNGCVSPVYVVFECKSNYHFFIDFFRKQKTFKKNVEKLAIGGVRQTLKYEDLARIELIIPPIEEVEQFNDVYLVMYNQIKTIQQENSRLSSLRDTLLPKLMSGQIKV